MYKHDLDQVSDISWDLANDIKVVSELIFAILTIIVVVIAALITLFCQVRNLSKKMTEKKQADTTAILDMAERRISSANPATVQHQIIPPAAQGVKREVN